MVKAFSYIRFSTPEQSKGDSLRRQLEAAREWCRQRGIELDDSLRDLGTSAYKGKNAAFGALRRFLDLVEDATVPRGSYLIVESLDRLSREAVLDAAARLFDLIRAGIIVVTLSDGQEYSEERLRTDWTPLIVSIAVMARAHDESRVKSQRVGNAWSQKRLRAQETGQPMSSIAPAWVKLVGGPRRGRYELIEERAAIVREIFHDTIGGIGRRSIARKLNERGVEPWGTGKKKAAHWHDSYIQKIIGNPATIGRFEPLGKLAGGDGTGNVVLENYYPPVIDEPTFYAAQAAAGARHSGQGRPSEGHRNILRGIARCGSCGANLILIDKGARSPGPKLICGSAHASARGCKDRTFYPYAALEMGVLAAVSDRLDEIVLSSRDRMVDVRRRRDTAIARRAERQVRLDNLIELVAGGAKSATLAGQVTALQSDIDNAEVEVARLDAEVKAADGNQGGDPVAGFLELRRQLDDTEGDDHIRIRAAVAQRLRGLVDHVVVSKGEAIVHLSDGGEGYVGGL